MNSLFPITEYWSWGTFLLYVTVSLIVCKFCQMGAIWGTESIYSQNYKRGASANSRDYYFLAFITLVLLGTLRTAEVGSDTYVYIGYFDNISVFRFDIAHLFSFNQMEPGFQLYLRLIHSISSSHTFLFFVNSILVAYAYIKYIRTFFDENSDYTFLQIFIFYYVSNMSGMRAALATVFLLLSYIQLAEKKTIKSILLTILACSFHYTMIYNFYIIILTVIFKSEKLRRKKWLWIIAIIATIGLAKSSTYVLRGLFAGTKYSYYTDRLEDQSLLGSLFFVLFGALALSCYRVFLDNENYSEKFRNIYLVSLGFLVTYPVIFVIGAYRIPNYYILPRLTVWDEIKKYYQNRIRNKQIYKVVIQCIVILYLLFRFTRTSVDGGFAYHWIF